MIFDEDPAVITWRIALAPRPRFSTGGRHWWRELVTSTYRDAADAWAHRRESDQPAWGAPGAAHSGVACYQLSDEEFAALFPRPRFGDFLAHLSQGAVAPERLEVNAT